MIENFPDWLFDVMYLGGGESSQERRGRLLQPQSWSFHRKGEIVVNLSFAFYQRFSNLKKKTWLNPDPDQCFYDKNLKKVIVEKYSDSITIYSKPPTPGGLFKTWNFCFIFPFFGTFGLPGSETLLAGNAIGDNLKTLNASHYYVRYCNSVDRSLTK